MLFIEAVPEQSFGHSRLTEENAASSSLIQGQGQVMILAAQASAGCISDSRRDLPIGRQPIFGSKTIHRRNDLAEREHRAQTRLARSTNEAALQNIVEGMRLALRTRNSIHIKRKEIAEFAGVTPALVNYYFPERDDLIEAVTLPIVDALVGGVEDCLTGVGDPRRKLLEAVGLLLECYARDAAIIDLFASYRASKADKIPDLLQKMEATILTFFEHWLQQNVDSVYTAVYLQKAAIGMCKIVARRGPPGSADDLRRDSGPMTQAEAICGMLLRPMAKAEWPRASAQDAGSSPAL